MGEIKTETVKDLSKEQEELLEILETEFKDQYADMEKNLSKEQKELLQLLETEFKDRYTEADKEFKIVWENDMPPPPIFVDWETHCENRRNSSYRRGYKDYPKDFKPRRYGVYDRPGRRTY